MFAPQSVGAGGASLLLVFPPFSPHNLEMIGSKIPTLGLRAARMIPDLVPVPQRVRATIRCMCTTRIGGLRLSCCWLLSLNSHHVESFVPPRKLFVLRELERYERFPQMAYTIFRKQPRRCPSPLSRAFWLVRPFFCGVTFEQRTGRSICTSSPPPTPA